MEFLIQNWDLVLVVVCAIGGLGFMVYKYLTLPTSKKKESIRKNLLNLVIEAERLYGSKKGKEKFQFVYGMLSTTFIWLKFIPVSVIEELVDEALDEMRELLEKKGE